VETCQDLKKAETPSGKLHFAFYPRSVAVIGSSRDRDEERKRGWVGRLQQFGYQGKIYPINPHVSSLAGLTAYPSVKDVPDVVDYAIMAVPRRVAPKAIEECISKGVKFIHMYTAGFAERRGDPEAKQLQAEIEQLIRSSNTRLIGPNCLGVYSPAGGLTFDERLSRESGPIAFFSQTGVGARHLIHLANGRGLRFSKAVSYGNAADLDEMDCLEYAFSDPQTKFILVYIEGLKDGRRFFNMMRQHAKVKPVILLKSGLTESGARAIVSHTASLAGSRQAWSAFFKQTGVIPVESLEEAIEQLVAITNIPRIEGRRIGLAGRGGAIGCIAIDMCERAGLKAPELAPQTIKRLAEIVKGAGSSIQNPVETGISRSGLDGHYSAGLQLMAADPNIDVVLSFLNPEDYISYGIGNWVDNISTQLIETANVSPKPITAAFLPGQNTEVLEGTLEIQRRCQKAGVACFPSLEVAVKAISKLVTYCEFKDKHCG
jgi:acyl-CoA synthetase (NDP forming)